MEKIPTRINNVKCSRIRQTLVMLLAKKVLPNVSHVPEDPLLDMITCTNCIPFENAPRTLSGKHVTLNAPYVHQDHDMLKNDSMCQLKTRVVH